VYAILSTIWGRLRVHNPLLLAHDPSFKPPANTYTLLNLLVCHHGWQDVLFVIVHGGL